jgi:hypothetical protein
VAVAEGIEAPLELAPDVDLAIAVEPVAVTAAAKGIEAPTELETAGEGNEATAELATPVGLVVAAAAAEGIEAPSNSAG